MVFVREIVFYRLSNGRSPVEEFLDSLSDKVARKVVWVLKLIEDLDRVPAQYFKKLVNTADMWEVRVQYSGNIYRILCFFHGGKVVVLTHAFQKKTQKAPSTAIQIAETRKQDYFRRMNHE